MFQKHGTTSKILRPAKLDAEVSFSLCSNANLYKKKSNSALYQIINVYPGPTLKHL